MNDVIISSHHEHVSFIPKIDNSTKESWVVFGADEQTFKKWVPEICGICCLKMVDDSCRVTKEKTLYSLTTECESLGGYKKTTDK